MKDNERKKFCDDYNVKSLEFEYPNDNEWIAKFDCVELKMTKQQVLDKAKMYTKSYRFYEICEDLPRALFERIACCWYIRRYLQTLPILNIR